MSFDLILPNSLLRKVAEFWRRRNMERWVVVLAMILAVSATAIFFTRDTIVSYGDSESHLNIAKRVLGGLTPGAAQLGGIWLPMPHILLLPFVYFDFLWRTGLAGSIVSGTSFVLAALFLYRTVLYLTGSRMSGAFASLVFISNPNTIYLQATPMTELTLIIFFTLSGYLFILYLGQEKLSQLIGAAFFGFCAALSRYDGWFLIATEAMILAIRYFPFSRIPMTWRQIKMFFLKERWTRLEGTMILFATLAFFSIVLWLSWDYLILGDPLYFTNSEFSARSQQLQWQAHGELPAYHNAWLSFLYYFVTSMSVVGVPVFLVSLAGFGLFLADKKIKHRFLIAVLLVNVFGFYVVSLFMGQGVIFIPHITPKTFEWTLFNVRYGVMMAPFAAIFLGYLFHRLRPTGRMVLFGLLAVQLGMYFTGYSHVLTYDDGVAGLSSAKRPNAEIFLKHNYDNGLVLLDDYARLVSIVRSGIPMSNVIYIGTKPYWAESMKEPEKYAKWIIIQKDDAIWKNIYEPTDVQGRLYLHFSKVYTSPDILIFKRSS